MESVQIIKIPCSKCKKVHRITTARYVSQRPIQCECGNVITVAGDMSLIKTKKVPFQ